MTSVRLPRLVAILLLTIAVRAVTFGNPIIHVDEQFYFVVADAIRHGALPYVDIWDRKSLGLFLVYVPAALFGPIWGIYAYQAMALAAVVATAWLIARLADRAGWARGGLIAALLYVVWIDFVDGQGGQAPIFYNPLIAGAVLVAGGGAAGRWSPWRGVAAMALVGLALQIKYACVFEGMWIGVWLLWRAWRAGVRGAGWIGYGAGLVLTALAPTLAAIGFYAAIGHADAFVYANFLSVMQRGSDPVAETIGNLGQVMACLAPLLLMSAVGLRRQAGEEVPEAGEWRGLLGGWLAASLFGLLIFGSWFNHYALPVIVPAACCSAGFAARVGWARRGAIALVAVAAVVSTWLVATMPAKRGTRAQFAALVAAVGRGPGCLYVYGNDPMLYAASGRCAVSRYVFPSHLTLRREAGSIGTDQAAEIERIFAKAPQVVVMPTPFPDYGEQGAIRARVLAHLARDYRQTAALPMGRDAAFVYVRR